MTMSILTLILARAGSKGVPGKNRALVAGRPCIAWTIDAALASTRTTHIAVSTDDPVMFDTDLTREYEAAEQLGLDPRTLYEHALAGALCDEETRARLASTGSRYDWKSVALEPR